MALTDFTQRTFAIKHAISSLKHGTVAAKKGDTLKIEAGTHPHSGQPVIHRFVFVSASGDTGHEEAWSSVSDVAYDDVRNQITGTIFTPGEAAQDTAKPTWVRRSFCISLDGDPALRGWLIHVYVGKPLYGGITNPDDGSWTGDGR